MLGSVRHSAHRLLVLGAACLFAFSSVAAAAPSQADIEAKKQQEAQARAEAERLRADLATRLNRYADLGRDIERTHAEIIEAESQVTALDASLERAEAALVRRAVELYRGDRVGMLELLLSAATLQDLWDRMNYIVIIGNRDTRLMNEVRLARTESMWLHESLVQRAGRLAELQKQADEQRAQIEAELAQQEGEAQALGSDVARLESELRAAAVFYGGEPTGAFNKELVISDTNFRAANSMTVEQIQSFLERQPGKLATHRAPDHLGRVRSTAEMIAEAAVAWNVSPKVILATLQKEQSLLADATPSRDQLDWAMGAGKADSRTFYEYKGFGNQIWWGAQKLDKNADLWTPGATLKIDGVRISPANAPTFGLYRYTPHFKGTTSFWMLYWRYFGDPLGG